MKKYQLSSVLKQLAKEQRTGTLMSVNEDNILGRIYLINGKPKAARCRNLQGKEALNHINDKLQVSLKFHKEVNLVNSQSVIDTNDSPDSGKFTDPVTDNVTTEEFISSLDITELTDSQFNENRLDLELTSANREILSAELVEYLGPVAQMIVSDLEDGISLRSALNVIAHEIGDMDTAIQFIEKVKLET